MKRILSAVMTAVLVLMLTPFCAAADEALEAAQALNAFGLFSGTGTDAQGNPIYELERQPTRQEAITMLVKLVGGAQEASKGGWETPFTDVDDWAKNWVGYAYAQGLTAGTSATTFGANEKTTAAQFLTFVLKALGYDANSDFSWDNAWPLAEQVGISEGEYNAQSPFTRGDMAIISYRALSAVIKGTLTPLSEVVFGGKQAEQSFFSVHFIDVGQADAALVLCDGEAMLIDGGNKADSDVIYSVLKKAGVSHLKLVVGTHAHEDHVGGIPGAFNYADADITLCATKSYNSDAFDDFVRYADQRGGGIVVPAVGDTYALGSAEIEILGVNGGSDTNDTSIVLMITYGETKFLFTGDAEREAEQTILNSGADLSATVLKVGHHGSDSSTTYPFLREVMPEYAVISVGVGNSYGHPTDATLSRLRDAGVTVFRTDMQGDIYCTSDGKTVHFGEKGGGGSAAPEAASPCNTVEALQEIVRASCDNYNKRTDKILNGSLSFAIVSTTEISLTYDISELIYADAEYLVDDVTNQILDFVLDEINESDLPEGVSADVTANYELSEDAPGSEYYPTPGPEPAGGMVWIPKTGSRYHSDSGCSNMKNPTRITESQAIARGYTPCKKCW